MSATTKGIESFRVSRHYWLFDFIMAALGMTNGILS